MKKIMVDMDDVLTYGNFKQKLDNLLGYEFDYNTIKGYYIQNAIGDKKDDFLNMVRDTNFYDDSELLPNCYESLKKLSEYYEIYICTDYIWPEVAESAGNNLKYKYNYLYQKLDFIKPQNYIFATNKSLINCEIKIDDREKNLENAETKLLFTAYHNKDIDDKILKDKNIIRVNSWQDITKILIND